LPALKSARRGDQRFILSLDEKLEPTFGNYLLGRLPELLADFKAASRLVLPDLNLFHICFWG
jgi:hypothetical protein